MKVFLSLLFFFIFPPQRKLRSISISSLSSFHFLFFLLLSREKEGWDVLANEVKRRRKLHFFATLPPLTPKKRVGVGARPTPCLVLHPIFIPRSQRRPKRREEAEMKDAAFLPLLLFPLPILRRPHGLAVKSCTPLNSTMMRGKLLFVHHFARCFGEFFASGGVFGGTAKEILQGEGGPSLRVLASSGSVKSC